MTKVPAGVSPTWRRPASSPDRTETGKLDSLLWSELTPDVLSVLMVVLARCRSRPCIPSIRHLEKTISAPRATRSPSGRNSPTPLPRW